MQSFISFAFGQAHVTSYDQRTARNVSLLAKVQKVRLETLGLYLLSCPKWCSYKLEGFHKPESLRTDHVDGGVTEE